MALSIYFLANTANQEGRTPKTRHNAQLTELRMEALRAQMNPHFIFNSLNSINRYIIKSDAKKFKLLPYQICQIDAAYIG